MNPKEFDERIDGLIKWVIHNGILANNERDKVKITDQARLAIKELMREVVGEKEIELEERVLLSQDETIDDFCKINFRAGYNSAKQEILERIGLTPRNS